MRSRRSVIRARLAVLSARRSSRLGFGPGRDFRPAAAIATGWTRSRPGDRFTVAPMSDGGPGFVEVLGRRLGQTRRLRVCGPLDTTVEAAWVFDRTSRTAFLECAQACGLTLLGGPPSPETAVAADSS